ncbi:MAG: tetraacyldisaccharide 4'-kinase [Calditrichaeota bacterium]|nr:tetraacyldisaccharide 4'-kinase [Calditrichota bacterium]
MKIILIFVRLLLFPVSVIYALITETRNLLYDLNILPVYRSKIPVISVGNITVGGTGKTPFTIWLAKKLKPRFKRIAVVSRGYGRKSRGMIVVARNGYLKADVREAGDEPLLIASRIPDSLVIVAEKRKDAFRWIEQNKAADLIILDDGFQHRSVYRNIDIVLFKASESFWRNFLLPTGTLRECRFRLKRADYLILTGWQGKERTLPLIPEDRQFKCSAKLSSLIDLNFKEAGSLANLKDKKVAAFAGIATPSSFFTMLQKNGIVLQKTFSFGDHYDYQKNDILNMFEVCAAAGIQLLLCTEKDLIKVKSILSDVKSNYPRFKISVSAVRLDLTIEGEKEFIGRLFGELTN